MHATVLEENYISKMMELTIYIIQEKTRRGKEGVKNIIVGIGVARGVCNTILSEVGMSLAMAHD